MQDVVKAGIVVLRTIHGKVNPADLLTKPKSAAEAGRLSESLGFELVMRKRRDGETLTGMVRRWMRGDKRPEGEKVGTLEWWVERHGSGVDKGRRRTGSVVGLCSTDHRSSTRD